MARAADSFRFTSLTVLFSRGRKTIIYDKCSKDHRASLSLG